VLYETRPLCHRVHPRVQDIYRTISGEKESVSLRYVSHCQRGPLLDVIQRDSFKDRAWVIVCTAYTATTSRCLSAATYEREGSQGQNKTFVRALKLAQFDFCAARRRTPRHCCFLDDIFDKLDCPQGGADSETGVGHALCQIFITIPTAIISIRFSAQATKTTSCSM
jgi:DNA replication and repair protein RecF